MDSCHSKAVNYRPLVVRTGFASAGWRPMDLQKLHRGCWPVGVPAGRVSGNEGWPREVTL